MSSGVSSPSVCAQAGGIVTGDAVYSGVLLAIDSSLVPEEKRSETPSMRDGLELHTETELRILGCELIQSAGILLRLPQVAMATGQVLFQRFFYSKSFIKHNCEIVSIACMNLASKIEECPRRVRDVINVFHHLKQGGGRRSTPLFLDQNYINTKNQVIRAERRVLKELGFCVHVKHPHKMIVMYMQVLECERNQTLVQTAWNYMNDALRTDVFVRFEPETIACACIYLAARNLQVPLPSSPHWFLLFGASECEIREICVSTLKLYSRSKPDIAQLEKEVEKKKTCLEEEKLKSVNYNMTPALSHTNTFSPASKPGSPRALKTEDESEQREEREERGLNSRIPVSSVKKEQIEVLQNGHVPSRGRSTSSSPPTGRSGSGTYSSRSSRSPSPRRRRRQRSPQVPSHESRHGDRRRRSRSCGDSQDRRHDDAKRRQESRERGERERSRDRGRTRVDGRKKHERGTRSAHSQQRR